SAKCADDLLALLRHLVGHAELERVPADRADHRQSDAGIPACRIERRFPPKEVALLLRRDDHPQAWPVLHAPAGIGALQLCPDLAARSVPNATQRNKRSVADALQDRPSHALANFSAFCASSMALSLSVFAMTSACDALIEARVVSRFASSASFSARTRLSRARVMFPYST